MIRIEIRTPRRAPSQARRIVSRFEIVQARFGIAFFAGEFVGGAGASGDLFAVGEVVHGVVDGGVEVGHDASRAEVVFVDEVSGVVFVFGKQ